MNSTAHLVLLPRPCQGMLERAAACVEPGIGLFFKRIERPTRSTRSLNPTFWHHGAEDRSISAWWPAYLQDIREISLSLPRARVIPSNAVGPLNNNINISRHMKLHSVCRRERGQRTNATRHGPPSLRDARRPYSVSRSGRDRTYTDSHVTGEARDDQFQNGTLVEHNVPVADKDPPDNEPTDGAPFCSGGPINIPLPERQSSPQELLRALLDSDDQEAYGKVWQLFVSIGGRGELAGDVLKYLSTSHQRVDLDHASRAYQLIPAADRGLADYQAAIKVACGRKQQKLAVGIHHEAFDKGFHTVITNTLLAFLIRDGLWKTAAEVWEQLPLTRRNAADPRNHNLWYETDKYAKLPEKLLQLIKRLEQKSAIFASGRHQIFGLGVQLLYRVFSSSDIMSSITGPGTLALLDQFHSLGLLKPEHYFSGIQTLNKMVGSRNRHQLATLLYRNLDMRFPKARLPVSVLGSLLAILCESDNNHASSRVILRRFATDWGKPDKQAYQKVLSACAKNGDSVNVHEVFVEYCRDYGKPTNLVYITPLLYVYARTGNVSETKRQFDRLHSDFAIEPNVYCWNILITAHARMRDHEGACQEFQNMRRAGIRPDSVTYGIMMGIYASSGDTEAVHQLVETARLQNVNGTIPMVDTLVHSYCLNDQVEDAENLVEAATQIGLKGSLARMWNTLLRHYAFRADTDAVLQTQERMKELSVPADDMTYAALMQALVNIGRTHDAANILRSLHFSNSVTATPFHYSIVLYGYSLENNHDMVAVIYNEMRERFPRIGLSARLSRLRSHIQKEQTFSQSKRSRALQGKPMNRGLPLETTLDFLTETLLEIDQSDLVSESPQPGFGRRSPSEAFPSVYLEFLITAYGRSGALQKAEKLFSKYQALTDRMHPTGADNAPSIRLLTAIMITLVQQRRFAVVDSYWNKALSLAIDKGRQRTLDLSDSLAESGTPYSSEARPAFRGISLQTPTEASWNKLPNPFLRRGDIKILAAHRYTLAAPLTQYMYSLSAQNLAANLPPLVRRLEAIGFSLSSKNWNHYIQVLSYSNDAELQLLAFHTFEEKLLPNMPPWPLMKRSKWLKNKLVDGSGEMLIEEPVQRKFIERFRSHSLVPTYWTMVYLGLALMKLQRRGQRHGTTALSSLQSQAPGTVTAVSRMPYLREKAQGLLLRARTLQGDQQKRPRRPQKADRAGLRGSRSPLDHIPLEYPLQKPNKVLERDQVLPSKRPGKEQGFLVYAVDQVSGEQQRSPLVLEAAGRYECEEEYSRRVRFEKKQKVRLLDQIREDAAQPRLMADEKLGEPFFEAELSGHRPSIATDKSSESLTKDRQQLLSEAIRHFRDKKQVIPRSSTSTEASDIRPAAVLSAARRAEAAESLHLLRRRRRRGPAKVLPLGAFRGDLRRKITLALTAHQPPQRVSNRRLRAFTKNKAARRMSIVLEKTR